MANFEPSQDFHAAAAYLSSEKSLKLSTQAKLELYGLFKSTTVALAPNTSRPSIFDMTGRAKWDAWSSAGKSCSAGQAEAERRYLQTATSLGWVRGEISTAEIAKNTARDETARDEDDIWDHSDDESASKRRENRGMGNTVSTISPESLPKEEHGIHSLAVSNSASELDQYLTKNAANINLPDEYGYTALHLAADRGHLAAVEILLKHGADTSLKDADDYNAKELAGIAGHDKVVVRLSPPQ